MLLASYAARTRTIVERDGYTGELLVLPQPEGPARLVKALRRVYGGLAALGVDADTRWGILARIALDCAPALRVPLMRQLVDATEPLATKDLAVNVGVVTKTAARVLDDLALLRVLTPDQENRRRQRSRSVGRDRLAADALARDGGSEEEKYPPARRGIKRGGGRPIHAGRHPLPPYFVHFCLARAATRHTTGTAPMAPHRRPPTPAARKEHQHDRTCPHPVTTQSSASRSSCTTRPYVVFITSEDRKYKYAYQTPDGRWLIERDYGGCGGGWRVTDTRGEYVCTSCRRNSDGHATIEPTLAAAKAFVFTEWAAIRTRFSVTCPTPNRTRPAAPPPQSSQSCAATCRRPRRRTPPLFQNVIAQRRPRRTVYRGKRYLLRCLRSSRAGGFGHPSPAGRCSPAAYRSVLRGIRAQALRRPAVR